MKIRRFVFVSLLLCIVLFCLNSCGKTENQVPSSSFAAIETPYVDNQITRNSEVQEIYQREPATQPEAEPDPEVEQGPEVKPEPEPQPEMESSPEPEVVPEPDQSDHEPETQKEQVSKEYVLNTNTRKFHHPNCASVPDIKPKNREDVTALRDELIAQGYSPCGRCKP